MLLLEDLSSYYDYLKTSFIYLQLKRRIIIYILQKFYKIFIIGTNIFFLLKKIIFWLKIFSYFLCVFVENELIVIFCNMQFLLNNYEAYKIAFPQSKEKIKIFFINFLFVFLKTFFFSWNFLISFNFILW